MANLLFSVPVMAGKPVQPPEAAESSGNTGKCWQQTFCNPHLRPKPELTDGRDQLDSSQAAVDTVFMQIYRESWVTLLGCCHRNGRGCFQSMTIHRVPQQEWFGAARLAAMPSLSSRGPGLWQPKTPSL